MVAGGIRPARKRFLAASLDCHCGMPALFSLERAVRPGRSLLVPMNEDVNASNLDETWNSPEFQAPEDLYGSRMVYRVKNGDSLYLIALKHRVTVAALKEWNHLSGNNLRLGQRVTIYSNPRIARR